MFVTMPMRPTSPCAMKPVTMARATEQAHSRTTRLSMKARSIGTRGSVMSGATGIPSAVAAPSTLKSLRCRILFRYRLQVLPPRRGILFEEHRRGAFFAANVFNDCLERVGEPFALLVRQPVEDRQQPFLCHGRCFLQQRAAETGQIHHEPPRVARIAIARDETGVDEARDHDRDGALIGERARCEIVERLRRRLSELPQHEKLRAGNAELRLRLPVADAQHPNEAADGIKDALAVGHDSNRKHTWDRIKSANGGAGAMPRRNAGVPAGWTGCVLAAEWEACAGVSLS